jgi:hypothetical protein
MATDVETIKQIAVKQLLGVTKIDFMSYFQQ